jgi:hypothetical protein
MITIWPSHDSRACCGGRLTIARAKTAEAKAMTRPIATDFATDILLIDPQSLSVVVGPAVKTPFVAGSRLSARAFVCVVSGESLAGLDASFSARF